MSVGFIGIAGADDMKEQAGEEAVKEGEEMINVSRTQEQAAEEAVKDGEEIIDEAEMQKEDAEMIEKHEMADETMKQIDEK